MRQHKRLLLSTVTVVALTGFGVAGLASTASATEAGPLGGTSVTAPTAGGQVVQAGTGESATEQQSRKKKKDPWVGGAAFDAGTGKWRATATQGDFTGTWGSYDTREEALAEGNSFANWANSQVMAGPGCTPPLVLC